MGINIKKARNDAGLSISQLSEEVGISRYYLTKLENGKALNPGRELMIKLSNALNVSVQELFFSEER